MMRIDAKNVARALEILHRHKTTEKIMLALAHPGDEILSEGASNLEMELAFFCTFIDVMLTPFQDKESRPRAIERYKGLVMAVLEDELENMKAS